ncbi:L10-interacting MYB domain-containing protein-like [Neltuma alba]|uniref:L10-interacting MYB domain-containing protein-like n=1 Tax=Neltuma alba TaxID=207710 RepID=UPI0010A3CAEB|nr:L10-interacting MYB domain-containing protein-like [Prosopis alba]
MSNDKGKAHWDVSTTGVFLKICMDTIYSKHRQGSSFTKQGWDIIHKTFNEKTGRGYEKRQLKNRLDNLRKEWKAFEQLIGKETGIGWDPERNTVVASDEWWERKKRENPAYEKFRQHGLKFRTELETLFKGTMASGQDMWSPSSTQPEPQRADQPNDYRPTMDWKEGSGDSEDGLIGVDTRRRAGVSDDLDGINLTANTSNTAPNISSGSGSQGKRKRGGGLDKYKKQKMPATKRIADAVSSIKKASISTATAINKISNSDNTTELTADLLSMEEIVSDTHICVMCCNLLANKTFRDIYAGLRENRKVLVAWLKHNAENPSSYAAPKNP